MVCCCTVLQVEYAAWSGNRVVLFFRKTLNIGKTSSKFQFRLIKNHSKFSQSTEQTMCTWISRKRVDMDSMSIRNLIQKRSSTQLVAPWSFSSLEQRACFQFSSQVCSVNFWRIHCKEVRPVLWKMLTVTQKWSILVSAANTAIKVVTIRTRWLLFFCCFWQIQQLNNGRLLRHAYLDKLNFLNSDDISRSVLVQTTHVRRTLQSAVAFLYGFLPGYHLKKVIGCES